MVRSIFLLCALLPMAAGQSPTSALEQAAKRSDVRVLSSSQIATLESEGSRAVFTALIVADPAQEGGSIRGVRIEFSDAGWTRSAYLDESHLQPLKEVVDRLAADIELLPRSSNRGGLSIFGSCEFRDHPESYPVSVDYCHSGWCAPALRFVSPTQILFAGRKPADLAAILGDAIEYLKAH